MKKYVDKIVITVVLLLIIIISMPTMTRPAKAADTSEIASSEMAQDWGFSTTQPEDSVEREATGANPWNGYENSVTTFGEVPLEIAVVGSRVPYDNTHNEQTDSDLDDIYYYDDIKRNSSDSSYLTMGKSGLYQDVSGLTDSSESDVRPSTTIAADMNGDGIDEIVRYYIDINYNGSENQPDGDISNFNKGIAGYEAVFYLEVIDAQTGKRITSKDNGKLLTVKKTDSPDFFIPDSVYYWSSYLQLTAGDFNHDGKKEVALVLPDSSGTASNNNLNIWGLSGSNLTRTYTGNYNCYSNYGSDKDDIRFSAFHLSSGDCDNDGVDELVFTNEDDVITEDDASSIHIIDYNSSTGYSEKKAAAIQIGSAPMGNAGVTVGDIDNDGLNEIVVGGFMVNKSDKAATYNYTPKTGGTTKNIAYYHEMAMAYIKYDNISKKYSDFIGFTVFRDDEKTAETCESGNDTAYKSYSGRSLDSSRRYRNSCNWTLPIQAVSLTGYVNEMSNDQVFFGNYMYYYNLSSKKFDVYETDGEVDVDDDPVAYSDFQAPTSSITALIPGSYLSADTDYLPTDGKEQLLVAYVKKANGGSRSFEMALMYEKSGTSMELDRSVKYVANAKAGGFNDMGFYPTVCAPNMDDDAIFTQYTGHAFTYTKPEVLNVIASVPYFNDIMDAYPVGVWGNPGSTYFKKSSGSSTTNKAFVDISVGWYFCFHQDISIIGVRLASIEMESSISVNTNYEYSKTIEKESSIEYETSGGQDSVVMVSSPLDVYQYRYYVGTAEYKAAYPNAVKGNPSTWGTMEVSLPGTPQTMVFPVERFNELAEIYGMEEIDDNFWMHTSGEPGTYPTDKSQFKNASNILSSPNTITAVTGESSQSAELSITETQENAYSFSLTLSAKIGAGVGGITTGVTTENTAGYGGSKASFESTTIGSTLNGFPDPDKYNVDLDTKGYGLSIKLHSYTTDFNGNDIMVLYYTVLEYHGLPKLPENFRRTAATESTIQLAWNVPEVISPKLKPNNYLLERYDPYYKKWITVDDNISVKSGVNTYTDTDVYAGESYEYRLTAQDSTKTITNAVTLTASTQLPGQSPPVITAQPVDTVTNVGGTASFVVSAKLPEGASATRIYYQWYQRGSSSEEWKSINGAIEKTLTLTGITQEMNNCQYRCELTRLTTSNIHCTVPSDYAVLKVLDHTPLLMYVYYYAGDNGSIKGENITGDVSNQIASGSKLTETSKVRFTAEPAPGYHVSQWSINGSVVAGNTSSTLVINSLSDSVEVNVVFKLPTYTLSYNVRINSNEGQGSEDWGTVSAIYNGHPLPLGEVTTLPGTAKITFTATPKSGYMVYYWANSGYAAYYTNTYTVDSLSKDSQIGVVFTKEESFSLKVSSRIINSDTAYVDNSSIIVRDNGTMVEPVSTVLHGSLVDITVVNPPTSAIVDSWTISRVNAYGKTVGTPLVIGSQSNYSFNQNLGNYSIVINYRIISTKKVEFGLQGGKGTISGQVVGNTTTSGTLQSGNQVQMYADVVFTAVPGVGELGVSGWIINGVYESSNSLTHLVSIDRNTTVKVVLETLPQAKDPAYKVSMNADNTLSLDGNSIASDLDGDTLTVTAIEADGKPDVSVATAALGTGENIGKLMITGVNEGNTSVKVEVSDDNGHSVMVIIPIKVVNNLQQDLQLTGVINTSVGKEDGKILGLDKKKTYAYKATDEVDYHSVSGVSEITGLKPGSYKVYCKAYAGYFASSEVKVEIAANEFAGGNGQVANPFQITTPEMLGKVRNYMDKNFILMNDLDLTDYLSKTGEGYNFGQGFMPLGQSSFTSVSPTPFDCTFDGNGKAIRGLKMWKAIYETGLFSLISAHGTVKNLGVEVNSVSDYEDQGGIAATNRGTISNCYVTGTLADRDGNETGHTGGLVGSNYGTIENCYSTADVNAASYFGGLVGRCYSGTIKNSYFAGKADYCTAQGCGYGGGLVGVLDSGSTIVNSYYDFDSSKYKGIGFNNLGYTSTESMKKKSTYTNWDFNNIWSIEEGVDYPKLLEFQATSVVVTEVTLDQTNLSLGVGETKMLSAVVAPENATNKNVTWSSDKQAVATVDSTGNVTAVAVGTATITVTTQDGSKTAVCTVTVTAELVIVSSVEVKIQPTKTTYVAGETLDFTGLVVTLHRNNSTSEDVDFAAFGTKGITISPTNGEVLAVSSSAVTITYTADNISVSQNITVNPAPVEDIDAFISPTSINYDLHAPVDIVAAITWNSASVVTEVVYGTNSLAIPDVCSVSGSALIIKSSYLNTLGLSQGDIVDFKISFDKGNFAILTVNIVDMYIPSANANLSSLTVNGSPVSGFNPNTTIYDVILPYGITLAAVGAIPEDAHASVDIMQVQNLPGDAIVVVTAEDKTTQKSYTIHFTLGVAPVSEYKTLLTFIAPTEVVGVANGTAKTAAALGLPYTITLITDGGNVIANVSWEVESSIYDPSFVSTQTFTLNGTVALPTDVENPNNVSLNTSISVTVSARSGGLPGGSPTSPDGSSANPGGSPTSPGDNSLSGSSSTDAKTEVIVNGTPTSVNGNDGYTATITAAQANTTLVSSAVVTLDKVTISLPAAVLSDTLGTGSRLTFTQSEVPASTQAAAKDAAEKANGAVLAVININLSRTVATGTEEIHNLSDKVTVTISITEEQAAAIAAGNNAYIYYYDPEKDTLTNMEAVFDLEAKTVSFSTKHFSSYVLAVSDNTEPPVSGVINNSIYGDERTITFQSGTAILDGKAIKSGDKVSSEGRHILLVTGTDGNTTTIQFVIDKSAPSVISVDSRKTTVKNKGITSSSVTVTVSDLSEVIMTVTRNGKAYIWPSDNKFTKDGKYVITVKDQFLNSVDKVFIIDKTAPVISVKTVMKGKIISIKEVNISSKTVTLNGKKMAWPKDNTLTQKGSYVITVTDKAKNETIYRFKL